jgi:hypothetical protein
VNGVLSGWKRQLMAAVAAVFVGASGVVAWTVESDRRYGERLERAQEQSEQDWADAYREKPVSTFLCEKYAGVLVFEVLVRLLTGEPEFIATVERRHAQRLRGVKPSRRWREAHVANADASDAYADMMEAGIALRDRIDVVMASSAPASNRAALDRMLEDEGIRGLARIHDAASMRLEVAARNTGELIPAPLFETEPLAELRSYKEVSSPSMRSSSVLATITRSALGSSAFEGNSNPIPIDQNAVSACVDPRYSYRVTKADPYGAAQLTRKGVPASMAERVGRYLRRLESAPVGIGDVVKVDAIPNAVSAGIDPATGLPLDDPAAPIMPPDGGASLKRAVAAARAT